MIYLFLKQTFTGKKTNRQKKNISGKKKLKSKEMRSSSKILKILGLTYNYGHHSLHPQKMNQMSQIQEDEIRSYPKDYPKSIKGRIISTVDTE